uniref:Uncharacterized protein n=1 Tax=Zea mays TaxID=4577 RepID=A0A804QI57_MAIZE
MPLLRHRRPPRAPRQVPAPALRGLLPQLRRRIRRLLRLHHHRNIRGLHSRRDGGARRERRAPVPVVPAGERRPQVHGDGRVPVLRQVHAAAAEAARRGGGPRQVGAVGPARRAAVPRLAGRVRLLPGARRILGDPLRRLLPVVVRRAVGGARRPRPGHGQRRVRRQARGAVGQDPVHALVARGAVAPCRGRRGLLQEQQEERVQPRGQDVRAPRLHHGGARHGRVHEQAAPQHGLQPGHPAGADEERVPSPRRAHRRRERVARHDAHQQLLAHPQQHPHHRAHAALPLHVPAHGRRVLLPRPLPAVHGVRAKRRVRRVGRGRRPRRRGAWHDCVRQYQIQGGQGGLKLQLIAAPAISQSAVSFYF